MCNDSATARCLRTLLNWTKICFGIGTMSCNFSASRIKPIVIHCCKMGQRQYIDIWRFASQRFGVFRAYILLLGPEKIVISPASLPGPKSIPSLVIFRPLALNPKSAFTFPMNGRKISWRDLRDEQDIATGNRNPENPVERFQNALKPIPAQITLRYDDALVKKGVPPAAHSYYRKWLMYCFGFCAKYHHKESNRERLSRFIGKLKEKKQVEMEREHASKAVTTFCESENRHHDAIFASNNKKKEISTKKDQTRSMGAKCHAVPETEEEAGRC